MRIQMAGTLAFCCLLSAITLLAQSIPSDEYQWSSRPYTPEISPAKTAIRVQSNLVEVPVVVRDAHDRLVGDLSREDFLLFDNGKAQTIQSLSVQNAGPSPAQPRHTAAATGVPRPLTTVVATLQPRYVALYFDDLNTEGAPGTDIQQSIAHMYFGKTAAEKFIHKGLDPGEKMGIFTASGTLSTDFTDDSARLLATIAKLRMYQRPSNQIGFGCPPLSDHQAWVIAHGGAHSDEWEAAIAAARACGCVGPGEAETCAHVEAEVRVTNAEAYVGDLFRSLLDVARYLSRQPGRRTIVVVSAGFLSHSLEEEQQKVIEAAVHAAVVIDTLDTFALDEDSTKWREHFNIVAPLSDLAQGTGGTFMHNNNGLAEGLQRMTALPTVSYLLSFSPGDIKADGSQHNFKVRLAKRSGLSVQARPSYIAPGGKPSEPELRHERLAKAVTAEGESAEIPAQVLVSTDHLAEGKPVIRIAINVDARKLHFEEMGERKVERLIFITALFDTDHHFLAGTEGVMDLWLKKPTFEKISSEGVDVRLTLNAPTGSYRIRQTIQEVMGGRLTAVNRQVVIQ